MYRGWTKAVDLEQWAARLEARQRLPALIRSLVWATTSGQTRFSFPADEGVQRTGWDGELAVASGNVWVPEGASVWELSTGDDPAAKAEENFSKRTRATPPERAKQLSFVFVTPQKWLGRKAWAEARRQEGHWRDVRALDSDDLEHWLEQAPAVDIWFVREIGKVPAGVTALAHHWAGIAALTDPPLSPEVFLAGRERTRATLRQKLVEPPAEIAFAALSAQEVTDFCAAAFGPAVGDDKVPACAVIVETIEGWRQLSASVAGLVLLPAAGLAVDRTLVAQAVRQGHHVVTQRPYTSRTDAQELLLPRAWRHDLEDALKKAGFAESRAARLARESGGSLVALQRLAAPDSGTARPAWAHGEAVTRLLPLMLLGAWDDHRPADRAAVERIAGRPYDEVAGTVANWLHAVDSPLRRAGTTWQFISREDAWLHLAPLLHRGLLDVFAALAREILSQDDPRFALPVAERMYAGIRDQLPAHSPALREGLTETVALLGTGIAHLPGLPPDFAETYARGIVRSLLSEPLPAARWFSLAPLLALLAEAAPDEFLAALEVDVQAEKPAVLALFVGDGGFFASSQHHYLMWALEVLAWHPDYLARTVLLLARLKALDPGGNTSPRPGGVLRGIFRFWYPQSAALPSARFEVIDLLLARAPKEAWELLIGLLPQGHDMAMPAQAPRWREWPATKSPQVTYREIGEQIEWTAQRLFRGAVADERRLLELTGHFPDLPAATFAELADYLAALDPVALTEPTRRELWDKLRRMVQDHEYYTEADWRMPEAEISRLRALVQRFRPAAIADQIQWLFDEGHIFVGHMGLEYEEQKRQLFELRRTALGRLMEAGGLPVVVEFAARVKWPALVGEVLGLGEIWQDWTAIVPRLLSDERPGVVSFARAYAWTVFRAQSWAWIDTLPLNEWPATAAVQFGLTLPFGRRTWALVHRLGPEVEASYWQSVAPWAHGIDAAEANEAIQRLLEHNRPLAAADCGCSAFHEKLLLPAAQLAEILQQSVAALNAAPKSRHDPQLDVYHLEQILQRLQEAPDADPARVAALEWTYLPLMAHRSTASPKFLHGELARNPGFFAECISVMYRPKKERGKKKAEPSEDARGRAELAHQLLHSWKSHPSLRRDGGVDAVALLAWIEEARRLCEAADRLAVCDIHIGQLLASAPTEADGSWPCIPVREIVEQLASEKVFDGLHTAIINGRGIHSRGHRDGGQQERDLAAKYHRYADASRLRWPRVSAMLRNLGRFYETDARRMDDRTEEHD
jgi:hypothetical protein